MPVKYKADEVQIKRGRDGTQTKTIKRFYTVSYTHLTLPTSG